MTPSYATFATAMFISMASMALSEVGYADSTNIVTQSSGDGSSSTRITRTSDSQRVVTHSGSNVDISVQSSGSSRSRKDWGGECDNSGFLSSIRNMLWPDPKCSRPTIRDENVPTAEEFKDRMRSRMR